MKKTTKNKHTNALVMLLVIVAVVHVVVLIAAQFLAQTVGLFGLKVFWAHFTGGSAINYIMVLVVLGGLYYYFLKK